MMQIFKVTVADLELEPNFLELLSAYAQESSIAGMPKYSPQLDYYKQLEKIDYLHLLAAYDDGALIGLICIMISMVPHYGAKIATTESFFVDPEQRKTGAGMKLLRQAEILASDLGAVGLFVSAPSGGRLADVMASMPKYRESNRVFFRSLINV